MFCFVRVRATRDRKDKTDFAPSSLRPGKLGRSGLRPYMTEARHIRSRCWRENIGDDRRESDYETGSGASKTRRGGISSSVEKLAVLP